MRPINRGLSPRSYVRYGEAIGDLEERLGNYCSYCERKLPVSLAVEHMAPKRHHPGRELEWDNFLLGCTNCNSVKGQKDVNDDELLWPDRDNTLLPIKYVKGGFVSVVDSISPLLQAKTLKLIELVGLHRHDAEGWPDPADRDKRWQHRDETWEAAELCLRNYEASECSSPAKSFVIVAAKGYGFFSIWMSVFRDHRDICLSLIREFSGTAIDCFDGAGWPINRPGGVV